MIRKRIKFRLERLVRKHGNPRIKVLKVLSSKTYNGIIFLTIKCSTSKNTRSKIILSFTPIGARFFIQYLNKELNKKIERRLGKNAEDF